MTPFVDPCARRTDLQFWEHRLRWLGIAYRVVLLAEGWTLQINPRDWATHVAESHQPMGWRLGRRRKCATSEQN